MSSRLLEEARLCHAEQVREAKIRREEAERHSALSAERKGLRRLDEIIGADLFREAHIKVVGFRQAYYSWADRHSKGFVFDVDGLLLGYMSMPGDFFDSKTGFSLLATCPNCGQEQVWNSFITSLCDFAPAVERDAPECWKCIVPKGEASEQTAD